MERESTQVRVEPGSLKGIYAEVKTHQFMVSAIAEGAHLKRPKRYTAEQWTRAGNMTAIYEGTWLALHDIGNNFGYRARNNKREGPRHVITNYLRHLRENCSVQLQEKYPWSEIKVGKPHTPKFPKSRGEKQDHASYIFARLRAKSQATESRIVRNHRKRAEVLAALAREDFKAAHEGVTDAFVWANRDLFVSLGEVAKSISLSTDPKKYRLYAQTLDDNGFLLKRVEHDLHHGKNAGSHVIRYYLFREQLKDAGNILSSDPQLDKFKSTSLVA